MSSLGFGFYASHPGEVIKDELEERGISQRRFAESIGMRYSVLNEILYNMHTAKKDNALVEKLKQIRRVAAVL